MLKRFYWILALTALAGMASAQDFFHRPSPLAGRTLLTLALFEEVRTELKTTPAENTKIDALVDKLGPDVQEAVQGAGDPNAIPEAVEKVNVKYDDEVVKVLTADQVMRLKQLFVQYNGTSSVTNAIIAKDLAITDEQSAKIKKLQAEETPRMMEALGGSPDDISKTMKSIRQEFEGGLDKILTDDQKKKLKDMEGDKFTFKKDGAGAPNR